MVAGGETWSRWRKGVGSRSRALSGSTPGFFPEQSLSQPPLSNDTVSAITKGDGLPASAPTQAQKEFCLPIQNISTLGL